MTALNFFVRSPKLSNTYVPGPPALYTSV